jgi:predicted PurR-regulated permease PerM
MFPSARVVQTDEMVAPASSGDDDPRLAPTPSPARVALQIIFIILAVAAGILALHRLERVVLLLMMTMFFAYLIAPLVEFAQRPIRIVGTERRLSRALGLRLPRRASGAGIFLAVPAVALVSVAGRHWLEWRGSL